MLRRKFIQTLMILTSSAPVVAWGSQARASGGPSGASSSNDASSSGGASNSGGASSNSGASNSGGASSGTGASANGASMNGASVADSNGASLYCSADGSCTQESKDGLASVNDNDLDDVLKSFQ